MLNNGLRGFVKRNWAGYFFLAPWLFGFVALNMIPMGWSFYLSFTRFDLFGAPEWIGLENLDRMFSDRKFLASVSVTVRYVFIGVPLQLMFSLFIATVLNKGIGDYSLRIYRAIYYVPSLFGSSVAVALLWRQMFGGSGLINRLLANVGIEGMNWVATPETALYTLIILAVWQLGAPMLIFLAGLKQIPVDLYESAEIDGAGQFAMFLRITLPLLTPIIFFNLIMQMIASFQAFTPAYIISGGTGGPLDSTLFYTLYLYHRGFNFFDMGYAAAMAWLLLATIAGVTALLFLTSGRWVFYRE